MAAAPTVIDVSHVVGVGPDADQRVPALVRAVLRTVLPDSWFPMGGTGSVVPVFNSKQWFLVVSNDDATAATQIQAMVDALKLQ